MTQISSTGSQVYNNFSVGRDPKNTIAGNIQRITNSEAVFESSLESTLETGVGAPAAKTFTQALMRGKITDAPLSAFDIKQKALANGRAILEELAAKTGMHALDFNTLQHDPSRGAIVEKLIMVIGTGMIKIDEHTDDLGKVLKNLSKETKGTDQLTYLRNKVNTIIKKELHNDDILTDRVVEFAKEWLLKSLGSELNQLDVNEKLEKLLHAGHDTLPTFDDWTQENIANNIHALIERSFQLVEMLKRTPDTKKDADKPAASAAQPAPHQAAPAGPNAENPSAPQSQTPVINVNVNPNFNLSPSASPVITINGKAEEAENSTLSVKNDGENKLPHTPQMGHTAAQDPTMIDGKDKSEEGGDNAEHDSAESTKGTSNNKSVTFNIPSDDEPAIKPDDSEDLGKSFSQGAADTENVIDDDTMLSDDDINSDQDADNKLQHKIDALKDDTQAMMAVIKTRGIPVPIAQEAEEYTIESLGDSYYQNPQTQNARLSSNNSEPSQQSSAATFNANVRKSATTPFGFGSIAPNPKFGGVTYNGYSYLKASDNGTQYRNSNSFVNFKSKSNKAQSSNI